MQIVEVTPEQLLGPLSGPESKYAPDRLYALGDLDLFRRSARVAVIGSRVPSEAGVRHTRRLAKLVRNRGAVVVSGLSQGIDAAAHNGALEAGGRTVAVLGTSLDRAYPREHADLQRQLAREQLVLTQFPLGTKTDPDHFVARGRTMALLSDVTVIMEAAENSLSLNQGWEALRLGRPLFIARSLTLIPALSWPAAMLAKGARILANETLRDLYSTFSQIGPGPSGSPARGTPPS